MKSRYYILKNKKVYSVNDVLTWGEWFERASISGKRLVKQEHLPNGYYVSSVFLGLDHNFFGKRKLVFETMVFNEKKKHDVKFGKLKFKTLGDEVDMARCSTWKQAEKQHQEMVLKWLKK